MGLDFWSKQALDGVKYGGLKWETTPPTQEGWYWVRGPRDGFMIVQYYNKKRVIKALIAGAGGNIHYGELKLITHWLGPLPVPEPPTKEG
jgi:hypothetical protein